MCIYEIKLSDKFGGPALACRADDISGVFSVMQNSTTIAENIPAKVMEKLDALAKVNEREAYHGIMRFSNS